MANNNNTRPDRDSSTIDPEIAELIGMGNSQESSSPDFFDLFEEETRPEDADSAGEDLSRESFPEITVFEEEPKPYFADKEYYQKVLSGEGDISKKVHSLLSDYLKADNPKDKTLNRERLITAYWELAASISGKTGSAMVMPKRLLLRFGILLPTLINKEQRFLISKTIYSNDTGEPVYYVDEWLENIAAGEIAPSSADETKNLKNNQARKVNTNLEKVRGHKDSVSTNLRNKISMVSELEKSILEKSSFIKKHSLLPNFNNLPGPYTQDQKNALADIQDLSRKLLQHDREITSLMESLDQASEKVKELEEKAVNEGVETAVDTHAIIEEFMTIKQMAKMSAGKKGNHFPVLSQQYMRSTIRDIATRENVISIMSSIENIDPGIFKRTFKRQTNRIVPYIILLPCYGEAGICWEPYAKFNRATSRGRLGIPLFPKELKASIIYALGDLRWQVAKETASYYWMEEGLTGWYYQWFTEQKMRGDVKESFINNYYLWITKEADGMQKLDKDVRGIFWRNIPFPQELKEKLRNRGFVYNELYKKDQNIAISDGY